MDVLFHILAIVLFLATLVSYNNAWRKRAKRSVSTKKTAPEASGAWPFIGHLHLLGGEVPIARKLGAIADKCGPIFSLRLGSRPALVVSSWEMIKECFTTNDQIFSTRPSLAVGKYLGYNNAIFSLAPYGPYWRDMRKMVTLELLTNNRLEKLKHVRASEIGYCIKDLYLQCAKNGHIPTQVTLSKWLEHLTFNISIRLLAGKRFSASTDEGNWHFEKAVKKELHLYGVFVVSDALPSLEWMDIGGYVKEMKQTAKEIDQVMTTWLEEHLQKMKDHDTRGEKDFMDVMLSTLPEDSMISGHKREDIIKATTMNLILTASESTSVTIIWALSLLLNNCHILKIAQEELDAQVGRNRVVEESDIKNLKYLQAIVKETLRLYPPGPLAGPREATEDCYVGKYFVPKGTRLIVNLWKLHRDPRVWSNPCEFQPERFLEAHADANFIGQGFEYIPFSSGRRMCPAMTFGLQVVHLILARLLQAFAISTPMSMPVDMSEGLGIAFPKLKPLEVLLAPRLPMELYENS